MSKQLRTQEIYAGVVENVLSGCGMLPYKQMPVNPPYHQMEALPMQWSSWDAFLTLWCLLDHDLNMADDESADYALTEFNYVVSSGIVLG